MSTGGGGGRGSLMILTGNGTGWGGGGSGSDMKERMVTKPVFMVVESGCGMMSCWDIGRIDRKQDGQRENAGDELAS